MSATSVLCLEWQLLLQADFFLYHQIAPPAAARRKSLQRNGTRHFFLHSDDLQLDMFLSFVAGLLTSLRAVDTA